MVEEQTTSSEDSSTGGQVDVFVDGAGKWHQISQLTAADADGQDEFGFSLALTGPTAVIGDTGHNDGPGPAYVFSDGRQGWQQNAELLGPARGGTVGFGQSVGVSGNTIVVGSSGDANDAGRAYVFTHSGNSWRQTTELAGADTVANDSFGDNLAISGNTIVVGSPDHDEDAGRAYVFTKVGGGWRQTAELAGSAKQYFGESVAIEGDTLVVGTAGPTYVYRE